MWLRVFTRLEGQESDSSVGITFFHPFKLKFGDDEMNLNFDL